MRVVLSAETESKRRASRAAAGLVRALSERGIEVTARQIERWRQAGVIPASDREWPGRGSRSAYSPEAVDQAAAVAELIDGGRSLGETALILFARGYQVDTKTLATYMLNFLVREAGGRLPAPGATWTSALPQARENAQVKARRSSRHHEGKLLRQRLRSRKRRGESLDVTVERYFTEVLMVTLVGEVHTAQGLDDVLEVGGIAAATRDRIGGAGPLAERLDLDELRATLADLRLTALQAALDEASPAEVEQAREDARLLIRFGVAFTTVVREATDQADASGFRILAESDSDLGLALHTPGFLMLRHRVGPELDAHLDVYRAALPRFEAMARAISGLPPEYRRYAAPGGLAELARLPEPEREKVLSALRAAGDRHAEDVALMQKG